MDAATEIVNRSGSTVRGDDDVGKDRRRHGVACMRWQGLTGIDLVYAIPLQIKPFKSVEAIHGHITSEHPPGATAQRFIASLVEAMGVLIVDRSSISSSCFVAHVG